VLKIRLAPIACPAGGHLRKIRAILLQEELTGEDVIGTDGWFTTVDTGIALVLLAPAHVIQVK